MKLRAYPEINISCLLLRRISLHDLYHVLLRIHQIDPRIYLRGLTKEIIETSLFLLGNIIRDIVQREQMHVMTVDSCQGLHVETIVLSARYEIEYLTLSALLCDIKESCELLIQSLALIENINAAVRQIH